ncbi:hypothetical protein DFH11DRAFT_1593741 [Phellopilus nigrolimitatus]|nr:hypothetical protein DFH11DRAFT_1593741 [Phellopilus nigrolimitatus]
MDESQSLEVLSDVLTQISANPYDLTLHARHIQLASVSGMDDQLNAARQMLTGFWPAGDEVWLPMIEARMQKGMDILDDVLEILALFQTAEEDYLSIPLLQKHVEFLIDRHAHFNLSNPPPEDIGDAFSAEWTRTMISSLVEKGSGHLTKSHLLWDAHFKWELEQLENAQYEERLKLILDIEDMLLARLKQPHSSHEQTFQSYSTFTTNYKPADAYEKLLVSASKTRVAAVKAYERRERNESYLVQSNYSPEAYGLYINYERRAKRIDFLILSTLYERAISDTAKRRFEGVENAETQLRLFWSGYCDILRTNGGDFEQQRRAYQRAVRSVPGSGAIWAAYLRFLERTESDVDVLLQTASETYDKALSSGLVQKDVEETVPLVLSRAGLVKRTIMTNNEGAEGGVEMLFKVLEDGIAIVRTASRQGDPRYRLEKYLADIYVNLADSPDLASTVWQTTAKHQRSSYLAWISYAETLIKQGKYDEARDVYKDVVSKNLDWPEAIFDAWVAFEHLYGSLEDLQGCLDRVEQVQTQVNLRRAKEAEKAVYQASQAALPVVATSFLTTEAQQAANVQMDASTFSDPSAIEVDRLAPTSSKKRKSEESGAPSEASKKAKIDNSSSLKRDRENSTVFVANLPTTVTEHDLITMFKDCGAIREIKITEMSNSHVGTVEFSERESVAAALTKDKKRISGQEISVHLAWQSTLYATNFPEKADDGFIRQLFGKFGVIFDVRWPSKKFKATRRFCYIQFTSPDAAQAALSLHEKELEPGLPISVFISNPGRKKERTDAGANDREVYVAGLSKFATKNDLEKLFKMYGFVKEVRMIVDDAGRSKGFAFVEFDSESSAQKALQANNHDLKNRRIAVTLADTRVRARYDEETASGLGRQADIRSRSVRIKGLPLATQEGLLQQVLEKVVTVKRLEVFHDSGEANVELESTADAGRLLLLPKPLQLGGQVLSISEELPEGPSKRVSAPPPKTGGSGMFVPRAAASRPRAGLGSMKKVMQKSARNSTNDVPGTPSAGKGQNDFRKLLG